MIGSDITWWRSAVGDTEGGAITAVAIVDNTQNNVWPQYTSAQRIAGHVETRKTFATNDHATESLVDPVAWVLDPPDNMTEDIGMGFDTPDDADAAQGSLGAWTAAAVGSVQSDAADTRSVEFIGVIAGGIRTRETVVLTGTTPVLTTAVFVDVLAVRPLTTSGTRTLTVKQGSGGSARGTIPPGAGNLFHWYAAAYSKVAGIRLPTLTAGASHGLWHRQTIAAGAGAAPSNNSSIAIEQEAA